MLLRYSIVLVMLSLCAASASAVLRSRTVPPNFELVRVASEESTISLAIRLLSSDMAGLHEALLDVSHPASPSYGLHLSKADVARFVAPTAEGLAAVTGWLASHNITPAMASPSGDSLRIHVPVGTANALLNAEYTEFVHKPSNTTTVRTLSYALPENVGQHIRFIYPTTQFHSPIRSRGPIFEVVDSPMTRRTDTTSDIQPSCARNITPSCLRALYRIPVGPATAAAGNEIVVSGFGDEMANKTDLELFLREQRPGIANATFGEEAIDAGKLGGVGTSEADLDIQYTVGMASRIPTRFISVGWRNDDEIFGFFDITQHLLQQDNLPTVFTTSYGFDETDWDGEDDAEVVRSLCDAYAQLGARGTTVIFSSGDGGVAGSSFNQDQRCDNGSFVPGFPSTCPFVTSVGATEGISPERAAPYSSGGFSNIFPRPVWQDDAVGAYLHAIEAAGLGGRYNASGRAFPDVALQGTGYAVYVAGRARLARGTSAAAPVFASVVALLNDERMRAGRGPVGWLNPLLYRAAGEPERRRVFNDVRDGSNPGCGTNGFPAVEGWDAVTGLGTPDFERLRALVMGY